MPDDLHLETVVSAVEATGEATADQCRADVTSLLDPVFNQYDTYSMMIVGRIAIRVGHLSFSSFSRNPKITLPPTTPTANNIFAIIENFLL